MLTELKILTRKFELDFFDLKILISKGVGVVESANKAT